jgi:hypothetical protein
MDDMESDNFKILLAISERLASVEGKLDAYNNLTKKLDRLEETVAALKVAPAVAASNKVGKLTDSIIAAIGTIIGGGIVFAIAKFMQ